MESTSRTDSPPPKQRKHKPLSPRGVAFAALIGTAIEYYDFFVYSTSVALFLGVLFFPTDDPLMSSLIAFATVGVGFIARPFGGLFFAHFGDKFGRKHTLVIVLLLMSGATILIGCLPTYADVGVLAPILLISLRFIQGFAVGGEWGGAVLLATEKAPPEKRAFYGTFPQYGSPLGLLSSAGVLTLVQLMPEEQLLAWGWRIPFLLSVVLLVVGLIVRTRIEESTAFLNAKENNETIRVPIATVVRKHWRVVVVGVAITLIAHSSFGITQFLPSYAVAQFDVPGIAGSNALVVASAIAVVGLAIISRMMDGRDRRKFIFVGALVLALWTWPSFLLVEHYGTAGLFVAMAVGYVGMFPQYAALGSTLSDMFPPGRSLHRPVALLSNLRGASRRPPSYSHQHPRSRDQRLVLPRSHHRHRHLRDHNGGVVLREPDDCDHLTSNERAKYQHR